MPVSYTIECTHREPSIVTNEETKQADVSQNEHPPVLCMSGGVFVLTLQQIRKAIFPAVSLPENPAKKQKNRLTRQLKALILGEHALGEDFILMRENCCKTAVLS